MRGPDIPLETELPEGYRVGLGSADERFIAFDALILHNLRLVWCIARTYVVEGLEPEDIAHYGMFGLRRAIEKFDASRGYKFSTYATHWIRQSITRGIDDDSRLIRLPVHVVEQMNAVLRVRDQLASKNGWVTPTAIANETGLPRRKVMELLMLETGPVSRDKPVKEGGDTLGDLVSATARRRS
jgi:RNA polymerase primary sigma factor